MSLTQDLIREIEHEAQNTRKMLALVPKEKFDWKPHEKSMSLKSLSKHIADLAGMAGAAAGLDELDLASGEKKEFNSTEDLVKHFESGTENTISTLKSIQDEDLKKDWTLRYGEHVIMTAPKAQAIRKMGLNHMYHHRAQLGVYLRMLNIPIPGMYGPSADER